MVPIIYSKKNGGQDWILSAAKMVECNILWQQKNKSVWGVNVGERVSNGYQKLNDRNMKHIFEFSDISKKTEGERERERKREFGLLSLSYSLFGLY